MAEISQPKAILLPSQTVHSSCCLLNTLEYCKTESQNVFIFLWTPTILFSDADIHALLSSKFSVALYSAPCSFFFLSSLTFQFAASAFQYAMTTGLKVLLLLVVHLLVVSGCTFSFGIGRSVSWGLECLAHVKTPSFPNELEQMLHTAIPQTWWQSNR